MIINFIAKILYNIIFKIIDVKLEVLLIEKIVSSKDLKQLLKQNKKIRYI
jgi:hypothetical protein